MDATGRSGTAMGAVEVEPRVALFVSHTSPLALVGFWGILKAGCAVVLMDTAASKDRIASILAEAQPQIILVQAQLLARLPQHEARVICLDAEGEALAREGSENVMSSTTLSNVAYLISTSGTTGVPKVVEIAHQGLSNLHVAQVRAFGVGSDDRVLQFSPMSFDAAVWEIMMAHLVGATLCLGTEEELEAGSHLAQFMRRARITVATLTPSVLAIMPPSETLPDLPQTVACTISSTRSKCRQPKNRVSTATSRPASWRKKCSTSGATGSLTSVDMAQVQTRAGRPIQPGAGPPRSPRPGDRGSPWPAQRLGVCCR